MLEHWRRYWPVDRPPTRVDHEPAVREDRAHAGQVWNRHHERWDPEGYSQWLWEPLDACYLAPR